MEASAVWCNDTTRAIRTATRPEAGGVFVGERLSEDLKTSHGGYKLSGLGREDGFELLGDFPVGVCVAAPVPGTCSETLCRQRSA